MVRAHLVQPSMAEKLGLTFELKLTVVKRESLNIPYTRVITESYVSLNFIQYSLRSVLSEPYKTILFLNIGLFIASGYDKISHKLSFQSFAQ